MNGFSKRLGSGSALLTLLALIPVGEAQLDRAFTARYNIETRGAIAVAGNTVMTCSTTTGTNATTCTASRNGTNNTQSTGVNDNFNMINVDVDTADAAPNSSEATLTIPAGSTVLWAGLYWGSRSTSAANRNQVSLRPAGATSYTTVTATQFDEIDSTLTSANFYQGFSEVTPLVRSAGSGTYRVANIKTTTGTLTDGGAYGGWALYVVYQNSSIAPRDITVFDGFARVNTANNVTTSVSGFRTPPSGTFLSRVRTFTYEGDRLVTGDNLQVNGITITNGLNPSGNFYNSSITDLGVRVTAKNPDYVDQLAIDIDSVDLPSGVVPNSATSANLTFTSSGDQYFPGVLTFTTDVFEPILSSNFSKTATNASGSVPPGPGDVIDFTISIQNTGNDNGNNVVVTDVIPSGMTYVPGSLQVVSGTNAGAKTDASGDDQAFYNTATGQVTFNLGAGATAAAGGTLAPAASTVIKLQARINSTVASGGSISNQASLSFTGAGGESYTAQSDSDSSTNGAQATTFTVTGRDYGDAPDAAPGTGAGNYQTTAPDLGPNHSVVGGLYLGVTAPDLDSSALQNAAANADDGNNADDEDGVPTPITFSTAASQSLAVPVTLSNTTGASATLVGFIDFNKDGDFVDAGESATASVANGATSATLNFITPTGLTAGTTYARFRLATLAGEASSPTGVASSGEVEDYLVSIGSPDLTVAKTHTGNFTRGGTGTYTITVGNSGNLPTSGTITLTDTLPTGLSVNGGAAGTVTVGGANGANWSCSSNAASPQVITCTSTTAIAAGGSSVFTIPVNVASGAASSVTNSVTVAGGGEAAANNTNNAATDPTTTVAPTDLTLTKSHGGSFTVGGVGTYSFSVNNTGGVSSSGLVTVTDTLPTGLTFVAGSVAGANAANWSCSASGQTVTCTSTTAVTAGGSSVFTFNVNVGTGTAPGTNSVTNTASVSGGGDSNTANNGASDPTTVLSPNLTIAKAHAGNFTRGGTGSYTLTVGNTGTAATSGTITVVDTLPTGLTFVAGSVGGTNGANWTCSASGQTLTCTSTTAIATGGSSVFTFTVAVATTTAASVTNTAGVSGGNEATANGTNNSASDPTTTVGTPDLTLDKQHSGAFVRGSSGLYTFIVGNSGSVATSGTVTLTDTLPANFTVNGGAAGSVTPGGTNGANWSCSSNAASPQVITCTSTAAVAAGGSSTLTLSVNVGAAAQATVTNTASVAGGGELAADAGNNSDADPTTTVSATDLTLSKTHTGSFTVGGTGTYTVGVANGGETSSSGPITVTDTLPVGLTVNGGAAGSVTVGGTNGANWTCSSNAASPQVITCTSTAAVAAGGSSVFSFSVGVGTTTTPGTNSVTNTASVSGGGDSVTSNNTASDPTTILSPDLTVAKTHTPSSFVRGSTGSYSITVRNSGTAASSGQITVTDTLPAGLSVPSGSVATGGTNAGNWTCSANNASPQVVTCTSAAAIATSGSSTFSFTVNVAAGAGASVTNTASVAGGGEATANAGNNTAQDPTPTVDAGTLTLSKTVRNVTKNGSTGVVSSGEPGDVLEYCISYTNPGGSDVTNTVLTDAVPPQTTALTTPYAGAAIEWTVSAPTASVQNLSAATLDDAGELGTALTVRLSTVPAAKPTAAPPTPAGAGKVCFQVTIN